MGTDQTNPDGKKPLKQSRRRPFLKGLLTGGLLGTLVAGGVGAFAHSESHSPFCRGGHGMRHAVNDPQAMRERIDFAVDWALSRVDASEEQRDKVTAIAVAAAAELTQLREQHHANRKAAVAALVEPQVNRAELDRIRSEAMKLAEQGSRIISSALADAADVLNPEQRAQLAEMAGRWSDRHHNM